MSQLSQLFDSLILRKDVLKMFEMDQACKVIVSNSHITYPFPRMLCPCVHT